MHVQACLHGCGYTLHTILNLIYLLKHFPIFMHMALSHSFLVYVP